MPAVNQAVAVLLLTVSALAGQDHPAGSTVNDLEAGARLFRANCAVCHGLDGSALPTADLRRGQFRRGSATEDLFRTISNGIPGTAMPPVSFTGSQLWQVVAFVQSLRNSATGAGGDARRGQAVLEGKGQCLSCHRIQGKGSRLGPDLSDIGAIRSLEYLRRSLLQPSDTILTQNRSVRAVTRDGATITGRRLNEDTHTIQLLDSQERLVSLFKSDLRELTTPTTSPMPSFQDKLTPQELSDLLTYLLNRKGQ